MVQQQASPFDGYATIRRSKGRVEQKLRSSSSSSVDNGQYEMIEMGSCRTGESKSARRKFDSEILYAKRSVAFDESSEVSNDIESDADAQSGGSDGHRKTFETFKPRNSIESGEDDGSDKDLQQSSDCFQSLPYDIIMSPLKSPHYINQLNAMRSKAPCDGSKQFSLYSRPESPRYGKLLYGTRSTSPSADSLADNSSSNSSTYSSAAVFKHTAMSQSLHLPHPHGDENVILINVNHSPQKANGSNLNYRKSFSHIQSSNGSGARWQHESANGNEESALDASTTMTKSLYNPSISTSQLTSTRRFATLAYPREKQHETSNKSTSSLNEKHFIYLDPILSFKIGSQTTLRTKPPVPWWELAIKSRYRQSCPPMQVNINFYEFTRAAI